MKSRISFFDRTLFKKDMTRFAPAWILYTVCLIMGMTLLRYDGSAYGFHSNIAQLLSVMGPINLCYALLTAQLLLGDLYNSRLCNAIHALPLRRETIFGTHVAAGMAFSFFPTLVGTALALLLGIDSPVAQGWQLPLLWLLGTNLQYLLFFGIGVLSAMLVGNRFAQAMVYAILNFTALLVYWLVSTLYIPLLFGLQFPEEPLLLLTPVANMAELDYLDVNREMTEHGDVIRAWFTMDEGWPYLWICAVIGAGLLAAACLLYRRRKLECAGDFMAFRCLNPIFLVVFTVLAGAIFHFFTSEILYIGFASYFYLVVGLVVGFFIGRMLLDRTTRVLRRKNFAQLAVLLAVLGASLLVTWLDPMGLVHWIPEKDEIVSIDIWPSHYSGYNGITLDDPKDFDAVLRTHEIALENPITEGQTYVVQEYIPDDYDTYSPQFISIHYTLKNGAVRSRYYIVDANTEAGDLLRPFFSSMDAVFTDYDGERTVENIAANTPRIIVGAETITDSAQIRGLLEAIEADCEAGTMTQRWIFRGNRHAYSTYWLQFDTIAYHGNTKQVYSYEVTVYSDCANTNTWLEAHGIFSDAHEEQAAIKY